MTSLHYLEIPMQTNACDRVVTELDHVRLTNLLARAGNIARPLHAVLDDAEVVPVRAVPADVVTMNSRVVLRDPSTGQETPLRLRYPAEADAAEGEVSVLSPMGTQMLGLRAHDVAAWSTPDGRTQSAIVAAVSFQPEANGQYLA